MKSLENLNEREKEMLLKFPAYIALLAANSDGKLDEQERKEAVQLTDIKSYASDALLRDYYKEVEKNFEQTILQLDEQLPPGKEAREKSIKKELARLEEILSKTDGEIAAQIHNSMKSYTEHVANVHHTPLELFLIPFFISGLTD